MLIWNGDKMQKAANLRTARGPVVAPLGYFRVWQQPHQGGASLLGYSPDLEAPVGLFAVGGGTSVLRDLAQAGWPSLAACCPSLPQHQQTPPPVTARMLCLGRCSKKEMPSSLLQCLAV